MANMLSGVFIFFLILAPVTFAANKPASSLLETPKIKCGPTSIDIQGKLRDNFDGVLYVKKWRNKPGCHSAYNKYENATSTPSLSIPLTDISNCGIELKRNHESREIEIFTIFVLGFHPNFVTAKDRAFAVHCVFRQQAAVTSGTRFNFVSDMTTRATLNGLGRIPQPEFSIIKGDENEGKVNSLSRTTVGDSIIFVWNTTVKSDVYGIEVLDCSAQTLQGNSMKIIENGCTTDSVLISNINYDNTNDRATARATAFKFPDSEDVWIKCRIATCIKKQTHLHIDKNLGSNVLCDPEVHCNDHRRKRRFLDEQDENYQADREEIMVINAKLKVDDHAHATPQALVSSKPQQVEKSSESRVCMLKSLYACSLAFFATFYIVAIISALFSCRRQKM